MEAQAAFPPGAGDDQRLDEVALHAVEVGWLVMLVDEAEGHQEQTRTQGCLVDQLAINVELLNFELARVIRGCNSVLDFVLGVELGFVVEAVADAEDGARQVGSRAAGVPALSAVIKLAVAPEAQVVEVAHTEARRLSAGQWVG